MGNDNKEGIKRYMAETFDPEKPYVFISYSHETESSRKVYELLVQLMKKGINFAVDTEYAGFDGNWIAKMYERIKSKNCRCMMSFYCEDYIYSRPSLIEQFVRYSKAVKKNNDNKPLSNIYISLYEDGQIKSHLLPGAVDRETKQKELEQKKIRSIKNKNPNWTDEKCRKQAEEIYSFSKDNAIYRYIQSGAHGFYNGISLDIDDCIEELASFDHLVDIKDYFKLIGEKEGEKWSNANRYDDIDNILSMLKQYGVELDDDIREKSICIWQVQEKTAGDRASKAANNLIAKKNTEMNASEIDLETQRKSEITLGANTIWHYTGKDAHAIIEWDGTSKSCKVMAKSKLATEAAGFAKLASARKLKESLISQKIIVDGYFVKDYECDKISTMINVLNGGSVSMPTEMKNGNLSLAKEAITFTRDKISATNPISELKDSIKENRAAQEVFEISLRDFVKKYDDAHFKKKSFDQLALQVDENNCYCVEAQESTGDLVWKFMMALIQEKGMEVTYHINEKCGGKNPVFIPSDQIKQNKLSYKIVDRHPDWAMCTNFSQYGWLGRLKKWSEIVGFDSGKIRLVFNGFHEGKATVIAEKEEAFRNRPLKI